MRDTNISNFNRKDTLQKGGLKASTLNEAPERPKGIEITLRLYGTWGCRRTKPRWWSRGKWNNPSPNPVPHRYTATTVHLEQKAVWTGNSYIRTQGFPREEKKDGRLSLGWCSSVGWAPPWEGKGCWFSSQSGLMLVLQARTPVGGTREATDQCFTHRCFSPSLSSSLPLFLKINK